MKTIRKKIVDSLCEAWYNAEKFSGTNYVACIKELKSLGGISNLIELKPKQVSPECFIEAINVAREDYKEYKLEASPNAVDEYLSKIEPDSFDKYDIVKILKDDKFSDFPLLLRSMRGYIIKANLGNNHIGQIFSTYRYLVAEGEILATLPHTNVIKPYYEKLYNDSNQTFEDGYHDILAISLIQNYTIGIEDTDISKIAEILHYYIGFEDIILSGLPWNNPSLNKVLSYMIKYDLGGVLKPKSILPKYLDIKRKYNVNDNELLERLNQSKLDVLEDSNAYTESNLKQLIPNAEFFNASVHVLNQLTKDINSYAMEVLQKYQTVSSLSNVPINFNNLPYWHKLIYYLIEDTRIKGQYDIINEYAGKIYMRVAGASPISDYEKKIVKFSDGGKFSHIILDVRDKYCNGHAIMVPQKFIVLEENLRLYGSLNSRHNDVINRIIKPVITNKECKSIILCNAEFYRSIVLLANNINDFKKNLTRSWTEDEYKQLLPL